MLLAVVVTMALPSLAAPSIQQPSRLSMPGFNVDMLNPSKKDIQRLAIDVDACIRTGQPVGKVVEFGGKQACLRGLFIAIFILNHQQLIG